MYDNIEHDPNFSTTRLVRQVSASVVEAEIQAAHQPEDKFETVLFLPEGEDRKGEGGLRTQGYFKQSQADKPLITVVTVVYNGEKFLEETILSVINQTYDNVEYIIIDGGSTDGTLGVIKKYDSAIDYWVSEADKGIYDAMNKGVLAAKGDWVIFMNAGDRFFNSQVLFDVFSVDVSQVDLIAGAVRLHNDRLFLPKAFTLFNLSLGMPFCHQGLFYKKVCLLTFPYNIKLKEIADNEQLFRMYNSQINCVRVTNVIAFYAKPGVSANSFFRSWRDKFMIVRRHAPWYLWLTALIFFKAYLGYIVRKIMR